MKILHLDDELVMQLSLKQTLEKSPFLSNLNYQGVRTVPDFLKSCQSFDADVIVIDLDLGKENPSGISVMEEARLLGVRAPLIILSGSEDPLLMSEAIQKGASDFLSKEESLESLCKGIYRCFLESRRVSDRDNHLQESKRKTTCAGSTMRKVAAKIERVILRGIDPVLVRGESGTGKELVAGLIEERLHQEQKLRSKCMESSTHASSQSIFQPIPFVRINCASLQGDTLESELFGHIKGAFTGADSTKKGLFEAAHGGWIFMDEVARLSLRTQATLLRTLESGEIRPLGSSQVHTVKVKVIAATNEDLEQLCSQGLFRRDLLERLRAYEIEIPPLRHRSRSEREEILNALLKRLSEQNTENSAHSQSHFNAHVPSLCYKVDSAARKILLSAAWSQSNVREMWNVLKSAAVEAQDDTISVACLPRHFLAELVSQADFQNISKSSGQDQEPLAVLAETESRIKGSSERTAPWQHLIDTAKSYEELENQFFSLILAQLAQDYPERVRSIRSLSGALGLGRHVVTKKLLDLQSKNLLPLACRHLIIA